MSSHLFVREMENCTRFTSAEGGARLAGAARHRNTVAAEHTSFIATTLLHEDAYKIRGSLSDGKQRSVHVTRASRVKCVAYDLKMLTDLTVTAALEHGEVADWSAELETKEVLVCTANVLQHILQEKVLDMARVNVLVLDSCHLICQDEGLKYIMMCYKECVDAQRPRILALTYPLFSQNRGVASNDAAVGDGGSLKSICNGDVVEEQGEDEAKDETMASEAVAEQSEEIAVVNENCAVTDELVTDACKEVVVSNMEGRGSERRVDVNSVGVYKNEDDFGMYQKLEWKIEFLENELCAQADFAEDIDNVKRLSPSISKPKVLIVEHTGRREDPALSEDYITLEHFMKTTVNDVIDFLNEHRYDPTEIYGEDMYEELKGIPDPIVDPKNILHQFLYILDELGPYAADKAAFSLLTKLEKLKIKVPYERHFLLLCLCTSALVKIRCAAADILDGYPNDWEKVRTLSTPKMLRFVELLEHFQPPTEADDKEKPNIKLKTNNAGDVHPRRHRMLGEIEGCDFMGLRNKIEDAVNAMQSDLREIHAVPHQRAANGSRTERNVPDHSGARENAKGSAFARRPGHRMRGRGWIPRSSNSRMQHMQAHPDALCGIVYMKEPLMAKVLFMLIVEMSRNHPRLSYICAQYCAIERIADPLKEPQEFEQQRRKQEEVLKKFRMHECNLLLATSCLEEGIDLPRCNLVLRWDIPPSYRSYGLCRGRARAPRSSCVLMASSVLDSTQLLLHNVATYKELDQIISRKCGCGIQNEPTQSEENEADELSKLIQPYTPNLKQTKSDPRSDKKLEDASKPLGDVRAENAISDCDRTADCSSKCDGDKVRIATQPDPTGNDISNCNRTVDCSSKCDSGKHQIEIADVAASVDLNSAIALINKYCGKLPSDTFTRLAPQWWMEQVSLPERGSSGRLRKAYICTLRLPLNCPVKYNIVGHPMPTRVLARRIVALQACRILHKSGELDNQLMPIGKENFKAPELSCVPAVTEGVTAAADAAELARPGTTKRRQYYYKRTAGAFTDCQPVIDSEDSELTGSASKGVQEERRGSHEDKCKENLPKDAPPLGGKRNMLYAIVCKLWCALPERYNTRGRRLHAPQNAKQALGILIARNEMENLQIPAFPVYTRSGEVKVSVEPVFNADVRMSPRRGRLVRRFMRFVFAEVLRVRRRGMKLQSEGSTHNNYYIVPTVKLTQEDGTSKIDIDWAFLEQIYQHTEEKKHSEVEKPILWHQDEEEAEDIKKTTNVEVNHHDCKPKEELVEVKKDTKEGAALDGVNNDGPANVGEEVAEVDKAIEELSSAREENGLKVDTGTVADEDKTKDAMLRNQLDGKLNENVVGAEAKAVALGRPQVGVVKDFPKGRYGKGKVVKRLDNPLLRPGEMFVFKAEDYQEAVVTPWYRNQDQPQFFLVAEICTNLSPDSAFPSEAHTTFRNYYMHKYGVQLTQSDQPLLDVDHTSARLNLLTPRYVNRKGVALPVSSERTRRAKRDRLDQKQILVPELCRVHPFAAPLWFATVALPCVLYRINALLIADEIRRAVAIDVGLGIPKINDHTCRGFEWPPLDFGWSLAEVLSVDPDKKKDENKLEIGDPDGVQALQEGVEDLHVADAPTVKTLNDVLQEKEFAENVFEIGTWSNEMASSIPDAKAYNDLLDPLPPNLTFCTSASGGTNWCAPVEKPATSFNPSRSYYVAESDCSFMSSDFDTDDSDFNSNDSDDEEVDGLGLCNSRKSNAAMGVRIEYKTAHEAEAVDVRPDRKVVHAPQPDPGDDERDRVVQETYFKTGVAPPEYVEKFRQSVEDHKRSILENNLLIKYGSDVKEVLPDHGHGLRNPITGSPLKKNTTLGELFPYDSGLSFVANEPATLESIERSKREMLCQLKMRLSDEELKALNCFSMKDINVDAPGYVNEKIANIGFDSKEVYVGRLNAVAGDGLPRGRPFCASYRVPNKMKDFDFDFQPELDGHPGPSPSVILQALTMSNANDGINLERLETIGDSFLKFAITAYLYCAHPTVHEGKLSHMRSKQVSNLSLYRLGRNKRLGARMIASKFEPHDNWLPPCHKPPPTLGPKTNNDIAADRTSRCPTHGQHRLRPALQERCICYLDGVVESSDCFIPYNLITQHSIPDKSIADCVEALIGAYLIECGPRGALLFMSWLGIQVLPRHDVPLSSSHPYVLAEETRKRTVTSKKTLPSPKVSLDYSESESEWSDEEEAGLAPVVQEDVVECPDWNWSGRTVGSLRPYKDSCGVWMQPVFGELKAPPSPLLRYIEDPEGELHQMLSGYDALERTLRYRFKDRSLLLQALTHASHQQNRLTDCYQRLEFLGDAILDYLITRYLYEDERRHSPGALTDLRSALVNNTIFATLAVRHGFHKYFRHMSPGLNEVLTKYVKIQEENGHSISEEHYLIQEDEMEQAEDVEVPKALGDLFESVAGAIFLDSDMSLGAVWRSYVNLMGAELEAFSAAAPKSPVRELLEAEPDTAKFGKPERLADGRRVRVCVEVFGRGTFKGVGRNYRIAKGTAARCALRHLKEASRV